MCGLFGVASSEGRKGEVTRRDAFRQGLQLQEWRGEDACGVALVRARELQAAPTVFKKAVAPSDFIRMLPYERLVQQRFDEYGYILGHARSATFGRGDSDKDFNAHPFLVGSITLTHNGHVRNYHTLGSGVDVQVDSAHVAGALDNTENPNSVLERLEGGFALVWHDSRDGSLNFARNKERPLWWCYVKGENTMFWGSELSGIYHVLERNDITIDGKFKHCTPFHHFKFNLKNLREVVRVPFVPRSTSIPTQAGSGPAWKARARRLGGTNRQMNGSGGAAGEAGAYATHQAVPSVPMDSTLITSIVEQFKEELEKNDEVEVIRSKFRQTRPTSRRKLRRAKEALLAVGRKLDYPICFTPTVFCAYKNQKPSRGTVYGRDPVRNQAFEMPNVLKSVFDEVKGKKIYGRISNLRKDKGNGESMVVCDFDAALQRRFIEKWRVVASSPGRGAELGEEEIRLFDGPLGRKITEAEYEEKTRHGCSNCSDPLPKENADSIMWVGMHGQYPLCSVCAMDEQVLRSLGAVGGF